MKRIIPMSEAFLYWDPEAIVNYPQYAGIETEWFLEEPRTPRVAPAGYAGESRHENA